MLCNILSDYPGKIDDMTFFQDNDLENAEIIDQYENLIAQGKYTDANTYINQQKGIYGYFADFFNLLENRIYSLQEYLLTKEKKQPFIFHDEEDSCSIESLPFFYEKKEETGTNIRLSEDTHNSLCEYTHDELSNLISEDEEYLCDITLFTDDDTRDSIKDTLLFTGEEQAPPDADINTIWI